MTQELLKQLAELIGGGAVLPLVVSLVTKSHWSAKVKQAVLIGFSALVAVLAYLGANGWQFTSATDVLAAFLVVFAAAQTAYHAVWKQSGITKSVSKLTDSKAKQPVPAPAADGAVTASDVAHDDSDIAPVVAEDTDAEPRRAAVAPVAPVVVPAVAVDGDEPQTPTHAVLASVPVAVRVPVGPLIG